MIERTTQMREGSKAKIQDKLIVEREAQADREDQK